MNAPVLKQLIHIGPLRQESEALLKRINLPSLVVTIMPKCPAVKGMPDAVKHVSAVIASQIGEATLYSYNIPGFDSLAPASGLKSLYPGIAETQRNQVETQPLHKLISEHCPSGTLMTHLVLDQPEQALSLLQAWQEEGMLDNLEGLFVRTSPVSLYEGMPTQAELAAWCQQHGFDTSSEKIDPDSSEDPEFILIEFKRNALHVPLKAAKEKVDTLKQECDSLKQQLSEKESTITQLREELASQQQNQEVIKSRFEALESKLEGKLESLLGEQRSFIKQTSNAVGQHVTRMSYQQRNLLSLSHYLENGKRLVSKELDSDYALALLEQYHSHRYDVALVFGSAAITELLASAEVKPHQKQTRFTPKAHHNDVITPSEHDLPTSIISIENQKLQCYELKKRLEASNCSQAVNVVYAPWVEHQYRGQPVLFYEVEDTLKRLNQWLPEEALILVIIGSDLGDVEHRHAVALLNLLQYLPKHSIEMIVEGLNDSHKSKLKSEFSALLNSRNRKNKWECFANSIIFKMK